MKPLDSTISPETYAPAFTKPPRTPAKAKKPIPRARSRPKKKKRSKGKRASVRHLKKRLWTLFAGYVKARDKGCFTCPSIPEGAARQAGHFVSAPREATRFDPQNVNVQCVSCNVFRRGNIAEYARRLLARDGSESFNALMERSDKMRQWKSHELLEMISALEQSPEAYETLYRSRYV